MIGRTYLEDGSPVVVLAQWGLKSRGQTHGGPRNVLIRRASGDVDVVPFPRRLRRIQAGAEAPASLTNGASSSEPSP